jgi:hypothetical protein
MHATNGAASGGVCAVDLGDRAPTDHVGQIGDAKQPFESTSVVTDGVPPQNAESGQRSIEDVETGAHGMGDS